jgi:hypothetical protein
MYKIEDTILGLFFAHIGLLAISFVLQIWIPKSDISENQ